MTIQALGLLGLLGIGVLILIYLLKPNHQQRVISSVYVWKLSLKYRKKRIDVNKFRNILILICQILILTLCAVILAKPLIIVDRTPDRIERVIIIDGSANMMAETDGITRFERAINEATALGRETINGGGIVTIITAGAESAYVTHKTEFLEAYNSDVSENLTIGSCSFQKGDIEGAVEKAQEIVTENQYAEVILYSATEYAVVRNIEPENFKNMSIDTEWNAAVLDVRAEVFEHYYTFYVDVASYKYNYPNLAISIQIKNTMRTDEIDLSDVSIIRVVDCIDNEIVTLELSDLEIYEFETVIVTIEPNDSFAYDNSLVLYGGTRENIRVQYASSGPNPFFGGAVQALHSGFYDRYNVVPIQVNSDGRDPDQVVQMEGYDYYIFEHRMPEDLPADGVVFLVNPNVMPEGVGIDLGARRSGKFSMRAGENHYITKGVIAENIEATNYSVVTSYDDTFTPLMYCGNDPVLLIKETDNVKLIVLTVNVHYSTLSMLLEFPLLFFNIFDYFMPATLEQYLYEVGDVAILNARGSKLSIDLSDDEVVEFTEFPVTTFRPGRHGTYTIRQTLLSGYIQLTDFYVKIASNQSDFTFEFEELNGPYTIVDGENDFYDLLIFLAAALVLLLFAEWYLQTREQS